ncbi:UNVERIFIED_CONTAM: hypothetical protein HDU68_010718 [Siphonaria sp. JEL0065]|nr:hypothetical protein HDU68_010718 [Siphonaria sp. JEL0065]
MDSYNTVAFAGTFLDPTSAKIGLALCLSAYAIYGSFAVALCFFRPEERNKSTDFFITARNSQSVLWSACSWFASAMGVWTLTGPPSIATGTGVLGLINLSVFTGLPLVMLAFFGSSVRENVPNATSVSSYAKWRYGTIAQIFVLLIVLLYLTMSLLTEYQAIAGIFATFFGCSPYVPLITVGIITMIYTTLGGLYVSIITDLFQTSIVLLLTLGATIYLGVSFKDQPALGPLPDYLGVTAYGWETFATLAIPFICGTFYGEGFWQRVWSAKDNRSLCLGAVIGGSLASIVIFILGFGGILAYWSGRVSFDETRPFDSNYAFFYAFADSTGTISPVVTIVILLFGTVMNESAVDSFQNAITDTLTTVAIGLFGLKVQPIYVRAVVLLANIPLMAGAAYLSTRNVSILNTFGVANLITTMTFPPLAAGLLPQLNNLLTSFSAIGSCVCAFFSTMVYAFLAYGNLVDGMANVWWTPNYDYKAFLVAFISSIVFIPVCIGVEAVGRNLLGLKMPHFNPDKDKKPAPPVDGVVAVDSAVANAIKSA